LQFEFFWNLSFLNFYALGATAPTWDGGDFTVFAEDFKLQ